MPKWFMKRTMITVASWLYTLHNDSLYIYIYTLLYTASTFSQKSSLQHLDQVTEEDPTRRRHGLVRRRPSGHRGRRPHWARGHRRSRHSRVRRGRTILLGEAENHRKFKLNIGLAMAANRKIILHSTFIQFLIWKIHQLWMMFPAINFHSSRRHPVAIHGHV